MRFEILTEINMRISVPECDADIILWKINVSDELTATVFRVEDEEKDRGSRFL
jgi:hypothetical protein